MIKVHIPRTLEELWPILEKDPDIDIYAGGTDYLVRRRRGEKAHETMACLERIESLKGISEDDKQVCIGACATFSQILATNVARVQLLLLVKAAGVLGSPHIRNMGTIGGNIATASPAADSLPPLYALDAEVELITRDSSRILPVKDFIKGPGKTVRPGEIISSVRLKKSGTFNINHFEKIGQRQALSIAIVSFAAAMKVDENNIIKDARLAWGSVGPTVIRSFEAEKLLIDRPLSLSSLQDASEIVREEVQPIDDIRASKEYRRESAGNILLRLARHSLDIGLDNRRNEGDIIK